MKTGGGGNWGTMSQQTAGPVNAAWNSTQGIGEIYSEGQTDATTYGYLRGGHWNGGSDAGVGALNLYDTPAGANNFIGFRCSR